MSSATCSAAAAGDRYAALRVGCGIGAPISCMPSIQQANAS
jgi:hypothetical protein